MSATISHFKVQAFEFNNSTKGDFGNGKLCLFAIDIVLVSGYPFTHYMLSKTDASCSPSAILFRMSTISQNLNNRLNVTSIFSCNLQQPCCSYEQQNYLPSFHYNVFGFCICANINRYRSSQFVLSRSIPLLTY